MNSGTTHVLCATYANHRSLPRNLSNTRVPKSVVRALTNSLPNGATNAKRYYVRVVWLVGALSFTATASNARFATRLSLIKPSSRRMATGTVCPAINTNMLRSVLDAIVISSMANIILWMRTAGTRNVSAVKFAGMCFNSRVLCRRTEKLNWFVRVVFNNESVL